MTACTAADLMESVLKQFQFSSLCRDQAVGSIHQMVQKHQGGVQFILWYLTSLQKAELSETSSQCFTRNSNFAGA